MKHQAEGFWDFSLRVYGLPGVSDACLCLHNGYGADINMLLFCCWAGAFSDKTDSKLIEEATEFSAQWALNVVRPIRSARTWMKHTGCANGVPAEPCLALREKIKSLELASERLQQEALECLIANKKPTIRQPEVLAANLHHYLAIAAIDVCKELQQKLSVIVAASSAEPLYRSSA